MKESGDKKKASFSIATSDSYKNAKGEKVEDTQWHNVVIWGKLAGVAEKYLKKGNEVGGVYVIGVAFACGMAGAITR